jgi:hypothetical protein
MDNFSYNEFIKFFFDRPDSGADDNQCFFQDDFEDPTYAPTSPLRNKTLIMNYICMAFREIEYISITYSERQFYCGWQYIIDWACGGPYRHYFFLTKCQFRLEWMLFRLCMRSSKKFLPRFVPIFQNQTI